MNRRMERVNVLLREEISRILANELNDPRISTIVSITRVEASPDLRHAKVHVSVFGDEQNKQNTIIALKSASGLKEKVSGTFIPWARGAPRRSQASP